MPAHRDNECKEAILACLARIPYGKVCSYGLVASLSGHPGKARYVAYLLKNLPKDSQIPWQRILNSQGKVAFPMNSDKYFEQTKRLQKEGIPMTLTTTLLRQYLWQGE